jgi:sortase (surface protein transpeptidase)
VAKPQIHKITEHHTALQKKAHTRATQSLTKSHISNADSNSSLTQQKSIPQAERTTREHGPCCHFLAIASCKIDTPMSKSTRLMSNQQCHI